MQNTVATIKSMGLADQEIVLNWLEEIDRKGLSMDLAELETAIETAPEQVRYTQEYHYLRGLYDGRFLAEEIR